MTPSGAAPARVIGAKMALEMRLPVARKPLSESLGRESKKHLVVPGDTITTDTGFMRYVGLWGTLAARGSCIALSPRETWACVLHLSARGTRRASAEHLSCLVFETSDFLLPASCMSPSAAASAAPKPSCVPGPDSEPSSLNLELGPLHRFRRKGQWAFLTSST